MRIKTNNSVYTFLPSLGILINSELEQDFSVSQVPKIDEKRIIRKIREGGSPSDEDIEEMLSMLRCITFCVTESCSNRCLYCIYGGDYENSRQHSRKRLKYKTAQKMIDYLITWISSSKRKLKHNSINIGFYGGEPLLEVQLIEKIMEYSRERFREEKLDKKFELDFSMTTNGSLLFGKALDLLIKNNVKVSISLDGPQEEHDKFRVTSHGKGTWTDIMKNLDAIRANYPEYYKNHINFLCTLHPLHDFQKIDEFFTDERNHIDLDNVITNGVTLDSLKECIKRNILATMKNQDSFLIKKELSNRLENKLKYNKLTDNNKFTGICMPGDWKLFIDTDGRFHFCEKVKADLPVGDVQTGFNFHKIRHIYKAWAEMIIKNRCWECDVWSFCSICPVHNTKVYEIDIDCSQRRRDISALADYLNFKEDEDRKKRESQKIETTHDYIRQLETLK